MADQDMEQLNRTVDEIAGKLDTLSASIDQRFNAVDQRFSGVDTRFDKALVDISEHFVEQRQYTELAFDTLRTEMRAGFAEMRAGFSGMHSGFEQVNRRLAIFIETQGGLNQNVERRTRALEHAGRRRKS